MSIAIKSERSVVSHEEWEVVRQTHHPAIYALDVAEMQALKVRLRELHGKTQTLARQKRREEIGKAAPRGKSFPGSVEQPSRRKQVFANALKRIGKELDRQQKLATRERNVEAAQRALAQARAAKFFDRPEAGQTAGQGMASQPSTRRRKILERSQIGSILKANKVAQAVRDGRS